MKAEGGGEFEALGREERRLPTDQEVEVCVMQEWLLAASGGVLLIVLWSGWLQRVKTNPDGRDSLRMKNRYTQGRHRMLQKPRDRAHTGLG